MTDLRSHIDDLDDPRLAPYRHLKTNNAARDRGLFVLEGEKLLDRLLASRYPVDSVLASERRAASIATRVPADVPLYTVSDDHVNALVGFNFHQGVLACGRRLPPLELRPLMESAEPGAGSMLLAAPQVDNPENLGALVRIADVFGLLGVLVGPRAPDPLSRRVLRVSMGTALRVPVIEEANPLAAVDDLRARHGYRLAATVTTPTAVPIDTFTPPQSGRIVVAFGCEAHGLDAAWVDGSDHVLTIPMRPGAESLNLSVAAGVVFHHLTRRIAPPAS